MGKRTIGVLTKLDLMDHGTNALDILSGRVYPLKLGFIGVVNRSQQDIIGNKSLGDALEAEREFFKHHPAYRNMANRCGTQYLSKTLNVTLMGHIRDRLPDIKARLNTLMGQTQQELASYGDAAFTGKEHRGSLILQLMTRFASSFISSIDGTSSEISTKELCGGARIYYIFNSVFGNALEMIDPTQNLSAQDIRTAIRNSTGPRPSLFVPEMAFDLLVKPQIKLLDIPSQRCVELVYEELMKICHTCGSTELSRYPRLQAKLIEVVSDLLRERLGPCSQYVESLIAIQRAYINTNHPNFLGAAAAMSSVIHDKQEREKKALIAEERRKRERRRLKELNGVNGTETPDDEDEIEVPGQRAGQFPLRSHQDKFAGSRSPTTVGRNAVNGSHSIAGQLNGTRGSSPPRFPGQASGSTKDGFLNYFFGKDGGGPQGAPGLSPSTPSLPERPGSRHVSQNIEPSFAGSLRRGDPRAPDRSVTDASTVDEQEFMVSGREYDSPFVSHTYISFTLAIANRTQSHSKARHPPSPSARPSKPSSSDASYHPTSTSSAKQSQTRSPKPSCTCSSTTPRTSYKIASSASYTRKACSKICCTKTTQSRPRERSARSSLLHIKRRPRSSERSYRTSLPLYTHIPIASPFLERI